MSGTVHLEPIHWGQARTPKGSLSVVGGEEMLNILLVEDTFGDALMAVKALESAKIDHHLETLRTGQQVLPYLEGLVNRQERLPSVIILDLGMPGMDGFGVLEQLASAVPDIRSIPIVVLTGYRNSMSSDYQHLDQIPGADQLRILGYLEKPCRSEHLLKLFQQLKIKNK